MKASNHIQIIYTQRPLQEPFSGGEIEFRFEQPPKKGQCFYTEPIDTGMGAGDHWLHFFFIDQMGTDEETSARRLVWGDVQVFNRSSYIPALPAGPISKMPTIGTLPIPVSKRGEPRPTASSTRSLPAPTTTLPRLSVPICPPSATK